MALSQDLMNARELRAEQDHEEYLIKRNSVMNRLRLNPEDTNTQWVLDELYELGYDQGSTMEAEFPTE